MLGRLKAAVRDALDALPLAYAWWRHGRPQHILLFDAGIGDELLCSALIRELKRRGAGPVWMVTHHPELFRGNPDVTVTAKLRRRGVRLFFERRRVKPRALSYAPQRDGRHVQPDRHVIAALCNNFQLTGPIVLRPYLYLSARELAAGARGARQIAIQSSGLSAKYAAQAKEWYPERFQALVDHYRGRWTIVQVGSAGDPLLRGALDLRGKTSLRETAAILSRSTVFIGLAGLLQHLARSADCRSVIIYGGRELPAQTGYDVNVNLTDNPACSPCWLYSGCAHGMKCMDAIGVDSAIAAIDLQLSRAGQTLIEDAGFCGAVENLGPCR